MCYKCEDCVHEFEPKKSTKTTKVYIEPDNDERSVRKS